jgi:hypothetical protein
MTTQSKVYQLDLFIKNKEEVEEKIREAKKRNFTRRINYLFGELSKLKSEIESDEAMGH